MYEKTLASKTVARLLKVDNAVIVNRLLNLPILDEEKHQIVWTSRHGRPGPIYHVTLFGFMLLLCDHRWTESTSLAVGRAFQLYSPPCKKGYLESIRKYLTKNGEGGK
jgi:hypothetical protein